MNQSKIKYLIPAFFLFLSLSGSPLFGQLPQYYPVGDMVFCLDASGSMNFILVPDPGKAWDHSDNLKAAGDPASRWGKAILAFQKLILELDVIVETETIPGPGGSTIPYHPRDGWVGIVQFPDQPVSTSASSKNFFGPLKIPDHAVVGMGHDNQAKFNFFYHPGLTTDIHSLIEGFTPRVGRPGTPMAHGLVRAKNHFSVFGSGGAIPNHPPRKRAIFLFTDGENNNPPEITDTWAEAFPRVGSDIEVRVYCIGFGNPAELAAATNELAKLASKSGGAVFFLDPGSAVGGTGSNPDEDAIAKTIKDQVISFLDYSGVIDPPFHLVKDSSKTFNFCISEFDTTIFVNVNLATGRRLRLPHVQLETTSGIIIDRTTVGGIDGAKYVSGENSQYFVLSHPFLGANIGDIKATITARETGNYDFNTFTRSGLGFELKANPIEGKTGDPIRFEMTFTAGTVSKSEIAASVVYIRRSKGLGNLFADNFLNRAELDSVFENTNNNIEITPAAYKYRFLQKNEKIPVSNLDTVNIVFNDLGIDGDQVSGDGIYSWQTDPITIPEVHKFEFLVRDQSINNNPFCRYKNVHVPVFVNVVTNWNTSKIKLLPGKIGDDGFTTDTLRLTLKDQHGNIVGPGFAKYIEVDVQDGETTGDLTSDLRGNYRQKIKYHPSSSPIIKVKFQGKSFPAFEPMRNPWGISLHYAVAYGRNDLEGIYKEPAHSIIADLEYKVKGKPLIISLMAGNHYFRAESAQIPDNQILALNLVGRYLFGKKRIKPFLEAGPGFYRMEAGDNFAGLTAGVGLKFQAHANLSFDIAASNHFLFDENNLQFFRARAGAILHF